MKNVDKAKKIIGERFQQLREGFGLNKSAFARELDISASYENEIEDGKTALGIDALLSLRRRFGVNINWLLTGLGVPFSVEPLANQPGATVSPDGLRDQLLADPAVGYVLSTISTRPETWAVLKKAAEVLDSGSRTSDALELNILEFHEKIAAPRTGRRRGVSSKKSRTSERAM